MILIPLLGLNNFILLNVIFSPIFKFFLTAILFVETYMVGGSNEKKSNKDNLLKSQELKDMLDDSWLVLHYDEFENEDYEIYKMKKQVLVARKKI